MNNDIVSIYLSYLSEYNNNLLEWAFYDNIKNITNEKIDKFLHAFSTNSKILTKVLDDHGVDSESITKEARSLIAHIKPSSSEKDLSSQIHQSMLNVYHRNTPTITTILEPLNMALKLPIFKATMLAAGIFFISKVLGEIIKQLINSGVISKVDAGLASGMLIGPFLEEYAKRVAIIGKYPWIYTGLFAVAEGIMYTILYSSKGFPLLNLLIIRTLAALMHFLTTFIQKRRAEKEVAEKKINIEDISWKGYSFGVIVHSLWNVLTLLPLILVKVAPQHFNQIVIK